MQKLTFDEIKEIDKNQLSDREIVYLKLYVELTLEEIALVTDTSKQYISQTIKGAMKKIEAQRVSA